MTALAEHDVGQAVAIEIAGVHACRGFALFFEQKDTLEGADDQRRSLPRDGDEEEDKERKIRRRKVTEGERFHWVLYYSHLPSRKAASR